MSLEASLPISDLHSCLVSANREKLENKRDKLAQLLSAPVTTACCAVTLRLNYPKPNYLAGRLDKEGVMFDTSLEL